MPYKDKAQAASNDKAYRAANKAEIAARVKAYAAANKALVAAQQKAYHAANKALVAARNQAYRKANPIAVRATHQRRRGHKRNASGHCTAEQLKGRIAFFGGCCAYCKSPYAHIDHAIPLSRGGSQWPANLRPSCAPCNLAKHARTWREITL